MLHSETNEFTDYVKKGVRENFNREAQVYKSSIGRGVDIYFRNDNAIKYISEIERGEISPVSICKCQSCHNMFLKGADVVLQPGTYLNATITKALDIPVN